MMDVEIATKRCSKCGEVKALGEFYKQKHGKYGVRSECKMCVMARTAEYRRNNREHLALSQAEYYRNNRERQAEYYRNNRDKSRVYKQVRRARIVSAQGTHTAAEMRDQFTRQKGICYYCDCKLISPFEPKPKKTNKRVAHWEHIIPLAHGGRNDLSNLVWTCAKCNLSKKDKLLGIEWKAPNGRLI